MNKNEWTDLTDVKKNAIREGLQVALDSLKARITELEKQIKEIEELDK